MQSKVTNGDISHKEQPEEAAQREEDNPAPNHKEKPKTLFKIEIKGVKPI